MSITINGATNTLTAASGLAIAGNTAVTGTLSATTSVQGGPNGGGGLILQTYTGGTFGAIYSTTVTPGATNYSLISTGANTYLNGTVSSNLSVGNTVIAAAIATGLAVTGTLSASGLANFTAATTSLSINGAGLNSALALLLRNSTAGQASPGLQFYNGDGYRHYFQESAGTAGLTLTAQDGTPFNIAAVTSVTDTTDATSTTAASLKTAGGLGVAKKGYFGDNIVMASGKGIDFSATSDGSGTTTSEVLSDYEEGTWTPALTWSTPGDQSLAYSTQVGTYTKVGRLVTCSVAIVTSTHTYSTATGALQISGLPFTAGVTTYEGASAHFAGITKASYTAVGLQVGSGSTVASFVASGSGQAVANIVPADVPSGTQVTYRATFSYIV